MKKGSKNQEKEKRKRNTWSNKFYVTVLVISVFIIVSSGIFIFTRPLKVMTIETSFIVSDNIGVDMNSTALTFGAITPGLRMSRSVSIGNQYSFPVNVSIQISKDIADKIYAEPSVIIAPGEEVEIQFRLITLENVTKGTYPGKIRFEVRKA